jgi:hypothetical protein
MDALYINLKRQIGREEIGGLGFLNNFLDSSIKKGGKRWNVQSARVFSPSSKRF